MPEDDGCEVRDALKKFFSPVNTELRRDLWPQVLGKLDDRPARVPWYDWALVGLSATMFLAFPRLILVLAYHL